MIVLCICGWFILQKVMQKAQADLPLQFPFSRWLIFAIPAIVIFCIGIGAAVSISQVKWLGWLILPFLTIVVIVLPILLFLGIGTNGIVFGPRWKALSTLGIGMTVGPLVMIVLEVLVLIFFVIIAAIFLANQPQLINELSRTGKLLRQGVNEEAAIKLLIPFITKPAVIASIFLYLSLIVPLIEELFKPLAVWLFASKLHSPANGFALGLLSGGAFALIESLNVSGDGSSSWVVIVSVRAGTSLLHMTTCGMMGHAIVQLFQQKKIGRFVVTYLTAAALHGLWNACAAGAAFTSLAEYVGKPEWLQDLPAAICGIAVLASGMMAVLIAANRKVRTANLSVPELVPNKEGVK